MENQELNNGLMDQNLNETNSSNNGASVNDSDSQTRYFKKNNKRTAAKRNAMQKKEEKRDRLVKERDSKKADLDRGYKIEEVENEDGEKSKKHTPLVPSERSFIVSKIAALEEQIFDLGEEIEKLDEDIKNMADMKTSSIKSRLKGKKKDKQLKKAVSSAEKYFAKEAENGSKEIVDEIKHKVQQHQGNEAYNSLMEFLRSDSSPVKKRFQKDPKLEDQVLEELLTTIENGKL